MSTDRRFALTPEALTMMDTIARSGSFAAAARELGKVPSALTYSVRQLEALSRTNSRLFQQLKAD